MSMINTPIRLLMAALFAGVMCWGTHVVRQGLKPASVAFPDRDFQQLPVQFGTWQGQVTELDPRLVLATEAKTVVDRLYRDEAKQTVSLHVALFADPDRGVFHSPINCYRSQGWDKLDEMKLAISTGSDTSLEANLTSWEKNGRHIWVGYWYELGEHILYDRTDLPWVRFAMAGKQTWPAMIKVLMETPATDNPRRDKERLQEIGAHVHGWIHQTSYAPPAAADSP
jgi:EpsI family protein